jgi:hypothetical protein
MGKGHVQEPTPTPTTPTPHSPFHHIADVAVFVQIPWKATGVGGGLVGARVVGIGVRERIKRNGSMVSMCRVLVGGGDWGEGEDKAKWFNGEYV